MKLVRIWENEHWKGITIKEYLSLLGIPVKLVNNRFFTNDGLLMGPLCGWYGTKDWGGLKREHGSS